MKRNFNHLNKDYSKGKLLVFGDMQLDTKGNKLIETLFLRGRHNKTGIIQCEQFTQSTAHIEKVNTDFFVLIPPFNESTAQYYHEKSMPTLSSRSIWKLGLYAEEMANEEDNPELRYLIINKFGHTYIGYKYRVCPFEDGKYAILKIEHTDTNKKPNIEIDKNRLDIIPYDENDCMLGYKCNKCKYEGLLLKQNQK